MKIVMFHLHQIEFIQHPTCASPQSPLVSSVGIYLIEGTHVYTRHLAYPHATYSSLPWCRLSTGIYSYSVRVWEKLAPPVDPQFQEQFWSLNFVKNIEPKTSSTSSPVRWLYWSSPQSNTPHQLALTHMNGLSMRLTGSIKNFIRSAIVES
jgi:hypothetical protein